MRSVVRGTSLIFKIFYKEIRQHLADLCNSISIFQMMLGNHAQAKDKQMYVNGTEYNMFTDTVSDSTVQLNFKKLPLVLVYYQKIMTQSSGKATKILFLFLTTYMYVPGFSLHIVQPKQ